MSSKGYYVIQNTGLRGPLTAQEVRAMAERGELKPDDGIRQVGQDQVHPARSVAGLFPAKTVAASAGNPRGAARPATTSPAAVARTVSVPSAPFASSKASLSGPALSGVGSGGPAPGGAGQGGGAATSGPRHPVTDLLTTLVLLQLEDLSMRVERREITEQRYQERSSLLFAQLRAAEGALLSGGMTSQYDARLPSSSPGGFGSAALGGASSPPPGHPDYSPPPAGSSLPSTLALGAAALGGGALGYLAARSNSAGGGPSGSTPLSGGFSPPAASGFSAPSSPSGFSAPSEPEPSLWSDLVSGSQRLARGWNAWRGAQSLFSSQTPSAPSGSGNLSPSSMASHLSSSGPIHASPEQLRAAQPFDSQPIDAQPIDVQPLDTEGITDAELVDASGHDSLGSQIGSHFSSPPTEVFSSPPLEPPHVEQAGSWFGGDATPEPVDASATTDGGWFGGGEETVEADGGDWFGGGSDAISDDDAGGDWFGGSTDVGLDVGGGDAGLDLGGDVDLSGFDGGGFEF